MSSRGYCSAETCGRAELYLACLLASISGARTNRTEPGLAARHKSPADGLSTECHAVGWQGVRLRSRAFQLSTADVDLRQGPAQQSSD